MTSCKGLLSQIGAFILRIMWHEPLSTDGQILGRKELRCLQQEADRCRKRSFSELLSKPPKTIHRRRLRGSIIHFQLATSKFDSVVTCGACGAWLFRPNELKSEKSFHVHLSDSVEVVNVTDCSNVQFGHVRYKSDTSESWKYDVQTVRCACCKIYLGLNVKRVSHLVSWLEVTSHGWCEQMSAPVLNRRSDAQQQQQQQQQQQRGWSQGRDDVKLPGSATTLQRQPPASSSSSSSSPPLPAVVPLGGVETCEMVLGTRYLRVLSLARDAEHGKARVELRCKKCENRLSFSDQILCTRRRWGIGNGPNEPACYMNSLVKGAFEVRNVRERELAQGAFDMADVFCGSCGEQVGYKFEQDKSPSKINENQQGRFGLVMSRLTIHNNSSENAN